MSLKKILSSILLDWSHFPARLWNITKNREQFYLHDPGLNYHLNIFFCNEAFICLSPLNFQSLCFSFLIFEYDELCKKLPFVQFSGWKFYLDISAICFFFLNYKIYFVNWILSFHPRPSRNTGLFLRKLISLFRLISSVIDEFCLINKNLF